MCSTSFVALAAALVGSAAAEAGVSSNEPASGKAGPVGNDAMAPRDIVVVGRNPKQRVKNVIDTIPAETIKAYGSDSVGDVVSKISGRFQGSVSILVNGRRLASIDDINALPPEALAQIEVLASGNAGLYGFPAGDNVINLALRPRFQFMTVEGNGTTTTEGGGDSETATVRYSRIRGNRRINTAITFRRQTGLLQSQRGGNNTIQGQPSEYSSLVPNQYLANIVSGFAAPLGKLDYDITLDAGVSRTDARTGIVYSPVYADGFRQSMQISSNHYLRPTLTLSGSGGSFFWSIMGSGEVSVSASRNRTLPRALFILLKPAPGAVLSQIPSNSRSVSHNFTITSNTTGPILQIPSGTVSIDASMTYGISSLSDLSGNLAFRNNDSYYRNLLVQSGINFPISSRGSGWLGRIGDLNLREQLQYSRFSGSGSTIGNVTAVNWEPLKRLSITFNRTVSPSGSSAQQRYAPDVARPGVLIFDALKDRVVAATIITGGRPELKAFITTGTNAQASYQISAPFGIISSSLIYSVNQAQNPLVALSNPSELAQTLLPDLFARYPDGEIASFDARPFNAKKETSRQISTNLHLAGQKHTASIDSPQSNAPKTANGFLQSWDFNLSYSYLLEHSLELRSGGARVDLIMTPISLSGSTASRHHISAQWTAGLRNSGFTGSLTFDSGSHVRSVESTDGAQTHFSSLIRINSEIFVDLSRSKDVTNPSSLRLKIGADNLLNARPRTSGYSGLNSGFDRLLFDPYGRIIRVSIRKSL